MDPEQIAEVKRRFLEEYINNGGIVIPAAEAVHVNRPLLYAWRKDDPEFDAAWTAAFEQSGDFYEKELHDRAVNGHDKPVTFQGAITDTYKEKSDPLLIMGLKARKRVYRDKVEVAGEGGGPVILKIVEEVAEVAK